VHRSVEILIGKLVTDEDFRRSFRRDPGAAIARAGSWGLELTHAETIALINTDGSLWERVAREVDERLQKASLETPLTGDLR
jgi:hypothetical protein